MKKISLYILIIISLIFLFPVILTSRFSSVETIGKTENKIEASKEQPYDYKKYGTINLINSQTNETTQIALDEYLYGVVSAEMPASYEIEALKAQAVVARTYTIYTITHNFAKHGEGTICTASTCCQAWLSKEERMSKWSESESEANWQKIVQAVDSTKGKVIQYNGEVIDAFFHSNSGGKTEVPVNVWGGTGYPYLQVVETAGEDAYSQYSSEVNFSKQDFENKMKEKYSDFTIDWNNAECIKITEYTDGGRARTVKIGNKELSGVEVRSTFGLKSANFKFTIDGDNIKFSVIGYGHGVGMSQTGADAMAKTGSTYVDIINHFYTGIEIVNI
ncbi:MAG: stage II sporulation protein D [Clostridia bacterium]|nr:stage II sporulation protein D [Clostridia bacterium]